MLKPLIELVIAGALWGFAFTATIWTLEFIDAPALLFYRFTGAALFGLVPLLVFRRQGLWEKIKAEAGVGWKPGIWLFLTLALQTFGLLSTTATKSAFITTLYVVFVPFAAQILGLDRLLFRHLVWVLLALAGLALFQDLQFSNWTLGDSLTLLAALAATMHILSVAKHAPRSRSPYLLNLWQVFWTGMLSLLLFPLGSRWSLMNFDLGTSLGFISLVLGAGLIAFYLQIRAQEKIPPNLASLLFLLESPFSAFFAYWLLSERFSGLQWIGGGVILGSCILAILTERPSKKAKSL